MSPTSDEQREEFRRRLTHLALREVIGGDSPPDLSDRILAAAEEQTSESPQPKGEEVMGNPKKRRMGRWVYVATACASVVFFVALLTVNGFRTRSLARVESDQEMTEEAQSTVESEERGPVSYAVPWGNIASGIKSPGDPAAAPYAVTPDSPIVILPQGPGATGDYGGAMGYGGGYGAYGGNVVEESTIDWDTLSPEELIRAKKMARQQSLDSYGGGLLGNAGTGGYEVEAHWQAPTAAESSGGRPGYVAQQNTARSIPFSPDGRTLSTSSSDNVQMLFERVAIDPGKEVLGQLRDQITAQRNALGQGPGRGGDQYVRVVENPFRAVKDHPLSTFSIDVDTASYANVRRFLMQENRLPPPDAVRIEELVNYFDYDYSGPTGDVPFASHIEVAGCPWGPEHRLVRIALKGYEIDANQRPKSNLVFLLDVSGSMNSSDKLPLLQQGMKLLAGQLGENDRVAIVVYAGSEGLVLPSTVGDQRAKVLDAIDRLKSGGSTNGGAGIELAYKIAQENFIEGGVNRVILCTDGDFNVGTTSTGDLERMVEEKAKSGVFLSVLGFGRGNLNDAMMETISNKGNGNYAYIDGITEAQKVLVEQMGGTLVTIAKDVKIQVEFNPIQVEAYRLIGYENRMLAAEDFNDDKKDAGEIGAGHTVTALYELVPAGGKVDLPDVDPLRYQVAPSENQDEDVADELLVLKLRYKEPDGDTSELLEFPTTDGDGSFSKASPDFQFAAAVASFGMLLRGSAHSGMSTYDAVLEIAESAKGTDKHGYRAEFVEMVRRAKPLGEEQAARIEEARKAMETARESAERAKPGVGLQGVVLAAQDGGHVEISVGSDDGVLKGHVLDVYRSTDVESYVGSIEVVKTEPDKAVCKVLPALRKGSIQVSDRVVAREAEE